MSKSKTKKVKVLIANAAGLYLIPYKKDQIGPVESKIADQMIEAGHAELEK